MKTDQTFAVISFWEWLSTQRNALDSLQGRTDPFWDTLRTRLTQYSEGVYFELSQNVIPRELIFTSHGNRIAFPRIDSLVAAAPQWEGWRFFALKPVRGMILKSQVGGVDFVPPDFQFVPLRHRARPQFLGLRIAIPGYHDRFSDKPYIEMAWHVIEGLIGERHAAELIDHVEVCNMPADAAASGFSQLSEIVGFLEIERDKKNAATH